MERDFLPEAVLVALPNKCSLFGLFSQVYGYIIIDSCNYGLAILFFRIWIRKLDEHWTLIMYKKNISRICYRFGDGLRVSLFCHTLK